MLYQFPFETALFTTLYDLTLIGLALIVSRIQKTNYRQTSFAIIFLLFAGWSITKLLGSSPGAVASTPNEIVLYSNSNIKTIYLARAIENEYLIYWREFVANKKATITIEMEGTYPDRLRILKKVGSKFKELKPDLTISGNTYQPIEINVSDKEFNDLSRAGQNALKIVWKRNFMNYTSTIISILFLVSFIWLTLKKPLRLVRNPQNSILKK